MNAGELLAVWRKRTGDTAKPPQWSDADGVTFLNDAVREACERADLLRITDYDSALTNLDGEANTAVYPINARVYKVNSCTWNRTFMRRISREQLNDRRALRDTTIYGSYFHIFNFNGVQDWSTLTGSPQYFLYESTSNALTLVKIPTVAAAIHLDAFVYPEPLVIVNLDAEPGIPARYHLHLVAWMERLWYDNIDADYGDPLRATAKEKEFTTSFGERPSANVQRTRNEHRSNQTRMNPDW